MPSLRGLAAPLSAIALVAAVSPAQNTRGTPATTQASRFLSLESGAYDAIARLRWRGLLRTLDPLAQPYRRDEVARALADLSSGVEDSLPGHVSHAIRLLRAELAPELSRLSGRDSVMLGFGVLAGVSSSTSRRRDPLLPTRDTAQLNAGSGTPSPTNRGWMYYGFGGWAEYGRFAAETRLYHDRWLRFGDPDGTFVPSIVLVNRTDNAYLSASFASGSFFVGRMRRNWAPIGLGGLMISTEPQTYPQIGFELAGTNLVLRSFLAELDTLQGHSRFVVAHHLEYRRPDFAISLGEARLYVTDRGLRLTTLNPFELFFFNSDTEPGDVTANLMLSAQAWLRRGRWTLAGEAFLDDLHVDDRAPVRGAVSGSVRLSGNRLDLALDYRAVAAFTYWTFIDGNRNNADQWSFYARGLGDNHSDYDRLSIRADLHPLPALRLTPTLQLQRKGEGDFRMPSISYAQFQTQRHFFLGVRESTVRTSLAGRFDPSARAFVEWDAGVNIVNNASHLPARSLRELSATMRLGFVWAAGVRAP